MTHVISKGFTIHIANQRESPYIPHSNSAWRHVLASNFSLIQSANTLPSEEPQRKPCDLQCRFLP